MEMARIACYDQFDRSRLFVADPLSHNLFTGLGTGAFLNVEVLTSNPWHRPASLRHMFK